MKPKAQTMNNDSLAIIEDVESTLAHFLLAADWERKDGKSIDTEYERYRNALYEASEKLTAILTAKRGESA